jgi:aminopeptidase N
VRRRPVTATLASTALFLGLVACSGDDSSSSDPAAEGTTGATATESSDPAEPDLAVAVNEPVEDSVYPDVGDPSVDALHYHLGLTWDPEGRVLTGEEELTFRSTGDADSVQLDLSPAMEVSEVRIDSVEAEFEHTGKDLVVSGEFVTDQQYVATIRYSGSPQPVEAPTTRADFTTTGFTVSPDGSAWTMQEPFGAYSWYAVNDHPSDQALYDFTLAVPEPWTGVANGELLDRSVTDGTTTSSWHLDSPAPSYLVTVAFGDYKVVEDESASGVPLSYWTPAGTPQKYVENLRFTKEALAWAEERLGSYPFSSLGVLLVDSQSGMETQTMITLGDTDYTTGKGVIVHEIVHQWYGDQVTPSDWSDLWMNEGMTMYLQLVWESEDTGEPLEQILRRAAGFERDSRRVNGPPGSYKPGTFGEIQVYYGPALMWDQVRRRVGDDVFWEMVRAWPSHDPDGSSNRKEYLAWVEEQTGTELSDIFDGWLLAKRSPAFP